MLRPERSLQFPHHPPEFRASWTNRDQPDCRPIIVIWPLPVNTLPPSLAKSASVWEETRSAQDTWHYLPNFTTLSVAC